MVGAASSRAAAGNSRRNRCCSRTAPTARRRWVVGIERRGAGQHLVAPADQHVGLIALGDVVVGVIALRQLGEAQRRAGGLRAGRRQGAGKSGRRTEQRQGRRGQSPERVAPPQADLREVRDRRRGGGIGAAILAGIARRPATHGQHLAERLAAAVIDPDGLVRIPLTNGHALSIGHGLSLSTDGSQRRLTRFPADQAFEPHSHRRKNPFLIKSFSARPFPASRRDQPESARRVRPPDEDMMTGRQPPPAAPAPDRGSHPGVHVPTAARRHPKKQPSRIAATPRCARSVGLPAILAEGVAMAKVGPAAHSH